GGVIWGGGGFGKGRRQRFEIYSDGARRTPAIKKNARHRYAQTLERIIHRQFPDWDLGKNRLSTSMDLERSLSPIYARGLLRRGRSSVAVLGVNQQETQASIDAALTFGLLWLEA